MVPYSTGLMSALTSENIPTISATEWDARLVTMLTRLLSCKQKGEENSARVGEEGWERVTNWRRRGGCVGFHFLYLLLLLYVSNSFRWGLNSPSSPLSLDTKRPNSHNKLVKAMKWELSFWVQVRRALYHLPCHFLAQRINPFTPKFKKYILPTFQREVYKWGSENW